MNVIPIVKFPAMWTMAGGMTWWMFAALNRPEVAWFTVGVYVAGYGGMVSFFYSVLGLVGRRMGGSAERDTARHLMRLRGTDWCVFNHLLFAVGDGRFDVDHVLTSSNRVLAIETKWTAWPHDLHADGHLLGLSRSWTEAAKRSATAVSHLLATHDVAVSATPVLVLWGPGIPRTKNGWFKVGRVVVWIGRCAEGWLQVLEDQEPSANIPPRIVEVLNGHLVDQVADT